jgi:hypothetical protein
MVMGESIKKYYVIPKHYVVRLQCELVKTICTGRNEIYDLSYGNTDIRALFPNILGLNSSFRERDKVPYT